MASNVTNIQTVIYDFIQQFCQKIVVTLSQFSENDVRNCHCLPSCNTLQYTTDVRTVAVIDIPEAQNKLENGDRKFENFTR